GLYHISRRVFPVEVESAWLSPGERLSARGQCAADLAASGSAAGSWGVAGGSHLRAASRAGRIRCVDHRAKERSLHFSLSAGAAGVDRISFARAAADVFHLSPVVHSGAV